jgi:hypothetical protein
MSKIRDEAIMVFVVIPGCRWEVEFFEDGSVEAEAFRSDGEIVALSNVVESLSGD